MRILLWFLLLAAAAVGVALAIRMTEGYVLFVAPPYRIEVALNLYLIATVVGFFLLYAAIRLIRRVTGLPGEVRAWRERDRRERARTKQDAALVALLESRHQKARQLAEEALALPGSTGLAALIGARSAIEMHDFDSAIALLSRPDAQAQGLAVSRAMLEAESELGEGRPAEALARLAQLRRESGAHAAALRLELRALRAAGRHTEIPPLVGELVKRDVYGAAEGDLLRAAAHADALRALANDAAGLRAYWSRLPDAMQRRPRVAAAAVESFVALGGDREAGEILQAALAREWTSELALRYLECRLPDSSRQMGEAEGWLAQHGDDPALLYGLGLLCERQEIWGKAQSYYEASLALEDSWRTRLALGEMLGREGRADEANRHLAAALRLATERLARDERDRASR